MKNGLKKEWAGLIFAFIGSLLGLLGLIAFNNFLLMSLPLIARMAAMIASYFLIAVIPFIVMRKTNDTFSDYGFKKDNPVLQIAIGVGLGFVLSLIFTLLPHLVGIGEWVDNGKRYQYFWQFAFDFVYYIVAVAFAEEFVFRGVLYEKLNRIFKSKIAAVVISSVLFGLFHVFGGNVVQGVATAVLGAIFCVFRLKIKNCSTLSLIIAHGIYDAMITVWSAVFMER